MNESNTHSSIQLKIQKMLELAKRGGTEAEANTAMHMVLEMLAKHNLSMSDIENTEIKDEDVSQFKEDGETNQPWQRLIWQALAHLYFCEYYSSPYVMNGKRFLSHVVTGKPSNMRIVKDVAKYIVGLGEELSDEEGKDRTWRNSYKKGFCARICSRCREEIKEASEQKLIDQETGTALVIAPMYALAKAQAQSFYKKNKIKLRTGNAMAGASDRNAYAEGHHAGGSVSLKSSASGRIGQ